MEVGRDFLAEEDRPGCNQVLILSYGSWQRYFGGRANIVGQTVTLNGGGYTVIGVVTRDFSFVSRAADYHGRNQFDLLRPMPVPPEWMRRTHSMCVLARMKAGVTLAHAQAELDLVASILERLYPNNDVGRGIAAVPLQQQVVSDVRGALLTLLVAVGLLLLITCANLANLLLTRAVSRGREIALRATLGASWARIARQLMTESLVLTATGGLLGLIFAYVGVAALVHHLPADLPRTAEIAVDWRVLIFTSIITLFAGLLFGPALNIPTLADPCGKADLVSSRAVAARQYPDYWTSRDSVHRAGLESEEDVKLDAPQWQVLVHPAVTIHSHELARGGYLPPSMRGAGVIIKVDRQAPFQGEPRSRGPSG